MFDEQSRSKAPREANSHVLDHFGRYRSSAPVTHAIQATLGHPVTFPSSAHIKVSHAGVYGRSGSAVSERSLFEVAMRPAIEAGRSVAVTATAYLTADKPEA
jgi:hypothetical protein